MALSLSLSLSLTLNLSLSLSLSLGEQSPRLMVQWTSQLEVAAHGQGKLGAFQAYGSRGNLTIPGSGSLILCLPFLSLLPALPPSLPPSLLLSLTVCVRVCGGVQVCSSSRRLAMAHQPLCGMAPSGKAQRRSSRFTRRCATRT